MRIMFAMVAGLVLMLSVALLPPVDNVVDSLFARQTRQSAKYIGASYLAEYRYRECNTQGTPLREESCRRRVYINRGQTWTEFLEVTLNGQKLTGRERQKQITLLRRKGLVQERARMPFQPNTRHSYTYRLTGEDTCQLRPVWVIEFTPRQRTIQTVQGHAFVDKHSYDVLALEFRPARLPWFCKNTRMRLWYASTGQMVVPVFFEMDMDIKVSLLMPLAERKLRIEDRYSEYVFCEKEEYRDEKAGSE